MATTKFLIETFFFYYALCYSKQHAHLGCCIHNISAIYPLAFFRNLKPNPLFKPKGKIVFIQLCMLNGYSVLVLTSLVLYVHFFPGTGYQWPSGSNCGLIYIKVPGSCEFNL